VTLRAYHTTASKGKTRKAYEDPSHNEKGSPEQTVSPGRRAAIAEDIQMDEGIVQSNDDSDLSHFKFIERNIEVISLFCVATHFFGRRVSFCWHTFKVVRFSSLTARSHLL
jgi:hypothetical protein